MTSTVPQDDRPRFTVRRQPGQHGMDPSWVVVDAGNQPAAGPFGSQGDALLRADRLANDPMTATRLFELINAELDLREMFPPTGGDPVMDRALRSLASIGRGDVLTLAQVAYGVRVISFHELAAFEAAAVSVTR